MKRTRIQLITAIAIAATLGVGAVVVTEAKGSAAQASERFDASRQALDSDIQHALGQGYVREDLRPILDRLTVIESMPQPRWLGDQAAFDQKRAGGLDQLRTDLTAREGDILSQANESARAALVQVSSGLDGDEALGVDSEDLAPLRETLKTVTNAESPGKSISAVRAAIKQVQTVQGKVTALHDAQLIENASVETAAKDLLGQHQGNVAAIQHAGRDALASGRNDATVAAFLKIGGTGKPNRALERYGAMLGSGDVDKAALAAAGSIRYAQAINAALVAGMPARTIVVSLTAQEAWGYQQGKVVWDSLVTTGRPELSTDIGPMKILRKSSPWTMHSPWPKGSPFWYPDTQVRKVVWFTNSGEGLHDASWRSAYGPGTNLNGSHGCINVPSRNIDFLFSWAQLGDPVIVIPGDGTSQAQQVSQDTIDNPALYGAPKGA